MTVLSSSVPARPGGYLAFAAGRWSDLPITREHSARAESSSGGLLLVDLHGVDAAVAVGVEDPQSDSRARRLDRVVRQVVPVVRGGGGVPERGDRFGGVDL